MRNKSTEALGMLWRFVKPYRVTFSGYLFCIIVSGAIWSIYPYVFSILVDEVYYRKNINFFLVIVLGYFIMFAGQTVIRFISNSAWCYLITKFLYDIRRSLYLKVMKLKVSYLTGISSGQLVSVLARNVDDILYLLLFDFFGIAQIMVNLIITISILLYIGTKTTLIIAAAVLINVLISWHTGKISEKYNKNYLDNYGTSIGWIFEMLSNINEIIIFGRKRRIIKNFTNRMAELTRSGLKPKILAYLVERLTNLIGLASNLVLFVYSVNMLKNGNITVGIFMAVLEYFNMSNNLIANAAYTYLSIKSRMVSLHKVYALLSEQEEDYDSGEKIISFKGDIAFKSVTFGYNQTEKVLDGFNMNIQAGERISIVGKSGVGKTTAIYLLMKFFETDSGTIQIDGKDIGNINLKALRKNISIVQQDPLLFNDTLENNLRMGNPKCSIEEIWDACEKANIAAFIRKLPEQMHTIVDEKGKDLSGGQRQRIAIARALLKKSPVIIFDEATSALDYESETAIQKALDKIAGDRTVIIIAHRLSTIINSDRVAVLAEGKVAACDNHMTLIKECEEYRRLFKEQLFEREVLA